MIPGLTHHTDPQGSEAWLQARRGLITGSRFRDARERKRDGTPTAAALGYAQDLARERCGGLLLPTYTTPAMRIGTEQEPPATTAGEPGAGTGGGGAAPDRVLPYTPPAPGAARTGPRIAPPQQ